jgi:hypothetical protein
MYCSNVAKEQFNAFITSRFNVKWVKYFIGVGMSFEASTLMAAFPNLVTISLTGM